jgi:hypothetical protein
MLKDRALRSITICTVTAQLSRCEREALALAREILCVETSSRRRTEALIRRATLLTTSVALERELRELESDFSTGTRKKVVPFEGVGNHCGRSVA